MTETRTRTTLPVVRVGMRTPWGIADSARIVAPGIGWVETPSHGGIKLSSLMNEMMPDYMRIADGWYEEDCNWSLPYLALSCQIGADAGEHDAAVRTLRHWHPDAYERFFDVTIPEGESHTKDQRAFKARHRNDLVVISAIRSTDRKGFVEATATVGGVWHFSGSVTYLVPSADYGRRGHFGFVIDDPAKYERLNTEN